MKSLAGKWQGQSQMNGETIDVSLEYVVSSAGSALIETLFMGTPHEMISVYHDEEGKLAMNHYCALANRPHLVLKNATANKINLEFGGVNEINPDIDYHIHAFEITFIDADSIVHRWVSLKNGKQQNETIINLKRVK